MRHWHRHSSKPFRPLPGSVPLSLLPLTLVPLSIIAWWLSGHGVILPAHAQMRDPIVTSDSPEYCGVLINRISGITRASTAPLPTEVAALSEEGQRMCVHGQIRGGILRLRRALEIIRHGED
jgi:hypothetical protein